MSSHTVTKFSQKMVKILKNQIASNFTISYHFRHFPVSAFSGTVLPQILSVYPQKDCRYRWLLLLLLLLRLLLLLLLLLLMMMITIRLLVRSCHLYMQVAFKLNTVVNVYNVDEDMTTQINELNPVRWKVRRVFCFTAKSFKSPSYGLYRIENLRKLSVLPPVISQYYSRVLGKDLEFRKFKKKL